jgi:hypothetical protein
LFSSVKEQFYLFHIYLTLEVFKHKFEIKETEQYERIHEKQIDELK